MSLLEQIMAGVETRLHQGSRPNSSNSRTQPGQPLEKFGHNGRPEVQCGRVGIIRNRASGVTVGARLVCDRKACPECGPRRRHRLAEHYTAAIGDTPVVRFEVHRKAWPTTAKRLTRAKAFYLRVPAPAGQFTVFATTGPGTPVRHLPQELAAAFEVMPSDLARVSSSRCWSAGHSANAEGGKPGEGESGWELLGLAGVTLDQVVEAAKDQGFYGGPVDPAHLLPGWGEAHLLRLPDQGSMEYRRFARRIRLHWPARHQRGAELAA
jgi:hypothetical protein